MTTAEMLLRLGAGVGLGALIGLERQYRARMAGLQTNALVAVGVTLFVLLSAHGFSGATADPTRVAAQIVSGIGFLGAAVILRDGLTVRGLSTAAMLCCSAAVGAVAGAGMFTEAAAGTVTVLAVHMMLRPLGLIVDRQPARQSRRQSTYSRLWPTRNPRRTYTPSWWTRRRARVRAAVSGEYAQRNAWSGRSMRGVDAP